MGGRIERQPYRVGSGNNADPEAIEELEKRRDKHERLTRGKPARTFAMVLADRRRRDQPEEEEAEETREQGAIEPHMGLAPGQDAALVNQSGKRSTKVIVKG